MLKQNLHSQFKGHGNEEGFGLGEVPSTELSKKRIDTHAIMSVVGQA